MRQTEPTDDEVAAALAAVQCYLRQAEITEDQLPSPSQRSAWRDAALLAVQHIAPARLPTPTWANIERLRRISNKG